MNHQPRQNDPNAWKTSVTEIAPNCVAVRGYNIAELMGAVSYGQMVYLILRGDLPDERIGRLMEAMLVAAIDHGATPPSTLAARTAASTGATLSAAVATGILCINQHHGGAIENCARALRKVIDARSSAGSFNDAAAEVIDHYKSTDRRIAGFGHRLHTADPRTVRLFELAEDAGVGGEYLQAAQAIENVFASRGKTLPINVDGAMSAVLGQLGFEPEVMNGIFMIARSAGLVAHVREEQTRMKPMRKIDPVQHSYDGPSPRSLDSKE